MHALEEGTEHGHVFPVTCGIATSHLGTDRLLDAIVEDLPSPAQHGAIDAEEMTLEPSEDGEMFAYVFKTRADPFAGRINLFRVYQGVATHDTHVLNTRTHNKERIGQLLVPQGKEMGHADSFGPGDLGAVAKLKETKAGDWLAARDTPVHMPSIKLPAPVMAFSVEPAHKGDEEKVYASASRSRSSRRASPTRRRSAAPPRPTGGTRSRPAGAVSSATATSRSSRSPTATSSSSTRSRAA